MNKYTKTVIIHYTQLALSFTHLEASINAVVFVDVKLKL